MKRLASLIRFRRSTAARLMAVLLVMLAVTPFTAPFSTCDLGVLAGNSPLGADPMSSDKKVQDDLLACVVSDAFTPIVASLLLPPITTLGPVESSPVPQLVLRL